MKNRNQLISQCEVLEGRMWSAILEQIRIIDENQEINLYQSGNFYGYLWSDFPTDTFNRIIGSGDYADLEMVMESCVNHMVNDQEPAGFAISLPPIADSSVLELADLYLLPVTRFEKIIYTDLSTYNLDEYQTNYPVKILEPSEKMLEQMTNLYLQELGEAMEGDIREMLPGIDYRVRLLFDAMTGLDEISFHGIELDEQLVAFGGIYVADTWGFVFNDFTHPDYRQQGMQTDLIIHRGLQHSLRYIFATITANDYSPSLGNAQRLDADLLYDRVLYFYDPEEFTDLE